MGPSHDTLILMADETQSKPSADSATDRLKGIDEVSLDMMKFIALTTGYGKPSTSAAGFSGKAGKTNTAEEYADALLELFDKCRAAVRKGRAE
jgi:hypothetical protein